MDDLLNAPEAKVIEILQALGCHSDNLHDNHEALRRAIGI
jgi:hypothetical protein